MDWPSAATVNVPVWPGGSVVMPSTEVMSRPVALTSMSLVSAAMLIGALSCCTVTTSATAIGGSAAPETVMTIGAVEVWPLPSVIV